MSFQTNKTFTYYLQGKVIEIYRITTSVDGTVTDYYSHKIIAPTSGGTSGIQYPDETITNGIRVEYTALVEPFIDKDPESFSKSADGGVDGGFVEVTSPSETSHVNLNRMLSLAIVDYLRAMFAERDGDLERKEYYMRMFYKKISDNESNKNQKYQVQSTSFSVK